MTIIFNQSASVSLRFSSHFLAKRLFSSVRTFFCPSVPYQSKLLEIQFSFKISPKEHQKHMPPEDRYTSEPSALFISWWRASVRLSVLPSNSSFCHLEFHWHQYEKERLSVFLSFCDVCPIRIMHYSVTLSIIDTVSGMRERVCLSFCLSHRASIRGNLSERNREIQA